MNYPIDFRGLNTSWPSSTAFNKNTCRIHLKQSQLREICCFWFVSFWGCTVIFLEGNHNRYNHHLQNGGGFFWIFLDADKKVIKWESLTWEQMVRHLTHAITNGGWTSRVNISGIQGARFPSPPMPFWDPFVGLEVLPTWVGSCVFV